MLYKTIVADPPWPYGTRNAITRCYKKDGKVALGVGDTGYPFMSMQELKDITIPADDPAHLYLWATNAFLEEAHQLAKEWGFTPKTCITWGKVKSDGTPSMKTGYYFRGATEHCLFAVRGSMRIASKSKPTLYLSPRLPHSVKPEWFYDLVTECSPGPYLELFARKKREGWHCWGNEVESDIQLTSNAL